MSAIVFVAPFLGLVSSLLLFYVFRVLTRGRWEANNSRSTGFGTGVLLFLAATIFFFRVLPIVTTHSNQGVSAQAANNYLHTFDIPAAATNVDFRTSFYSGLIDAADFDLGELDFLNWMADNVRKPMPFSTGQIEQNYGNVQMMQPVHVESVSTMLEGHFDELQIESGFYYDDYDRSGDDDSGITIIYDSAKQRVYVRRTTY